MTFSPARENCPQAIFASNDVFRMGGCKRFFGQGKGAKRLLHWCNWDCTGAKRVSDGARLWADLCFLGPKDLLRPVLTTFKPGCLLFLRGSALLCSCICAHFRGQKLNTNFFSQTFRALPGYPGKIPGYPAQKV